LTKNISSRSYVSNGVDSIIRTVGKVIMSKKQQIGAWIGIIGGGIGFFFFSMYAEDFFR
jgi:pyrroline-5-carboxylate reductase